MSDPKCGPSMLDDVCARRTEQEQRLGQVARAAYELGNHDLPWNEVGLATKRAYIEVVGSLIGPRRWRVPPEGEEGT